MVPWWLCILSGALGVFLGGMVVSILVVARRADEAMDRRLNDMRRAGW